MYLKYNRLFMTLKIEVTIWLTLKSGFTYHCEFEQLVWIFLYVLRFTIFRVTG